MRGIPIFTVGIGSEMRPRDLAIHGIEAQSSVFFEDRVKGSLTIKDDMPAGQPFTVAIKSGGITLWEQKLTTENRHLRKIPFDFSVEELTRAKLTTLSPGVKLSSLPLELEASVTPLPDEVEKKNNERAMRLRAVTQWRRILLVDGRPRWETRYLRNLFERDGQWEVNALVGGVAANEQSFSF